MKELETFVTDSKDGFILFTLGSMTPGSSMPKKALQAFMNVFAKLPQTIIWKWENEAPENLPKNILLSKWLPQQDLLGIEAQIFNIIFTKKNNAPFSFRTSKRQAFY